MRLVPRSDQFREELGIVLAGGERDRTHSVVRRRRARGAGAQTAPRREYEAGSGGRDVAVAPDRMPHADHLSSIRCALRWAPRGAWDRYMLCTRVMYMSTAVTALRRWGTNAPAASIIIT